MASEPEELKIEDTVDEDEVLVEFDITTYPSDFTLTGIHKMWQDKDIVIPEFQREFVWTIKQSSLLIESFLLGLPVPPVFFYIDDENKNLVIDGQQRICSVVYYFDGLFGEESTQGKRKVFRLVGLSDKSPYYNKKLTELPQSDQRKLQNSVLRAINVRQLSPKENNTSIYHIFERLNTGGTALNPQEIRNCVFRGDLVKRLRELNEDPKWRLILGKKNLDMHQRDVELVLRLFALSRSNQHYEKPMKEYLNLALKKDRNAISADVLRFIELFPKVCALICEKIGRRPFNLRGPLNTSALDSIFCTLLRNYENLPEDLKDKYKQLIKDEEYDACTYAGTTDTLVVNRRFRLAKKYLIGE